MCLLDYSEEDEGKDLCHLAYVEMYERYCLQKNVESSGWNDDVMPRLCWNVVLWQLVWQARTAPPQHIFFHMTQNAVIE